MTRPLLTVRSDRFAVDAALDMLYAGVQHLAVTDARGAVVGLVSAGDLVGLAYWSPFALRAAIFNAASEAALDAATKELPSYSQLWSRPGSKPPTLDASLRSAVTPSPRVLSISP